MTLSLRLAITADLHWGAHRNGDAATHFMLEFLRDSPPDVLVVAGDVGASWHFADCLSLFADLPCRKALVPGNHDIWVEADDPRGNSFQVYKEYLPRLCAEHQFHYLDQKPLYIAEANLALVGSINWYDYSWSLDRLKERFPDSLERLQTKRFTRGRHNDARFVRWPLDDVRFTQEVVAQLEQHLWEAVVRADKTIVVTHHPPFYGLKFPNDEADTLDSLLWEAFSGNRSLEKVLADNADAVAFAFCGHTHRARENNLGGIRGYNIGGDYHFKRLLLLDWPRGSVEAYTFGDPDEKKH